MSIERKLRTIPLRLLSLVRRNRVEAEFDEEVQFHLQSRIDQEIANGADPVTARTNALRALGNTTLLKEESRETWGWTRWNILVQDVRYALRTLLKSPGFTLTALLTLALGIGASTTMFSLVDSVLLKPLSYRESGRLVAVWEAIPLFTPDPVGPNPRHADILRRQSTCLTELSLVQQGVTGLAMGDQHPHLVGTVWATTSLFEVLQVKPQLGRTFRPEDGVPGRHNVAILTNSLWRSVFQRDPNIIGKMIRLGDVPREVVGVLPPDFHFPNRNALRSFNPKQAATGVPEPAVFLPDALILNEYSWSGEFGNRVALARLKTGIELKQAETELNSLLPGIAEHLPAGSPLRNPGNLRVVVQPMREAIVAQSQRALWLLLAAVIGLLLIACVNLANAQLARSLSRQREVSVRVALGAPRWRLIGMTLTENLLLAAAGGIGGVLVAAGALGWFRDHSPVPMPRLDEVRIDLTVLVFSAAMIITSALLFSFLPALNLLRTDPQAYLQHGGSRSLGSHHSRRIHTWLIGVQVFGCTALLLVTALFGKNLVHVLTQERGFDSSGAAFAQVNLAGKSYGTPAARAAFIGGVLTNLRALPGVRFAGYVSAMPLEGESWIESMNRVDEPLRNPPLINLRFVSEGYLESLGHRLVAGRLFEERDRNLQSVVLSQSEARALWPTGDPVGQLVAVQGKQFAVIGVVADSRSTSLKHPPSKTAYVHYTDRSTPQMFFMVRAKSANELVNGIRQAIWKHDPNVAIVRANTMEAQVTESLAAERFQTFLLAGFGLAALLLAMVGIHGVLSFAMAARRQEMGVRVALGAARWQIYSLAFSEVTNPVLAGLAAGVTASLTAGRAIKSMLFGVQDFDPLLVVLVVISFFFAAFVAGYWPARRAAAVDPVVSLRAE